MNTNIRWVPGFFWNFWNSLYKLVVLEILQHSIKNDSSFNLVYAIEQCKCHSIKKIFSDINCESIWKTCL